MPHKDTPDSRRLGVGLVMVGATLVAATGACALAVSDHMAGAAALCGPVARHCILCIASAGSLLASASVVAAGVALLQPRGSLQRARATRRNG